MRVIMNVSQSQLSTARHYGGCRLNGEEYIYIKTLDALMLKSLVRRWKKFRKERKSEPELLVLMEFLEQ